MPVVRQPLRTGSPASGDAEKTPAQQAQGLALSNTLASLSKCYGEAKPGRKMVVMSGLGALLLPERKGLYAEKLAMRQH